MRRFVKSRSGKTGLPPGSLIHIGEKRSKTTAILITYYDETTFEQRELRSLDEGKEFLTRPGVSWVHVAGVEDASVVQKLKCFNLHPLVLEDIMNTDQRTKFDDYGEYVYLVLKMLSDDGEAGIGMEQVSIVLGRNFVISAEESPSGAFDSVRAIVEKNRGQLRQPGPDYLAYLLLDKIVDNYFVVLEKLGDRIEVLQDEIVTHPAPESLKVLHELRRETLLVRRSIWPLREVIATLERSRPELMRPDTLLYLRDVHDHVVHIVDNVETFREMLSGMLDIYLSSASYRLNEILKVLALITTIFMPLTFIAGIYGMNFEYMPELHWRWAYPAVLIFMAALALGMVLLFRRKGWWFGQKRRNIRR